VTDRAAEYVDLFRLVRILYRLVDAGEEAASTQMAQIGGHLSELWLQLEPHEHGQVYEVLRAVEG
jgi:hypothetical protein